jgi:hypothetical protein
MTPAILTLLAAPSFASGGSGRYEGNDRDETYGGNDRGNNRQSNWDYHQNRRSGRGRRWF